MTFDAGLRCCRGWSSRSNRVRPHKTHPEQSGTVLHVVASHQPLLLYLPVSAVATPPIPSPALTGS